MTALKKVFNDLLVERKNRESEIEELLEDYNEIEQRVNLLRAEISDLDRTIGSLKRVIDDDTKPTFAI